MLRDRQWVLDGGLGSTLQETGFCVDGDPLWSASLLATNPHAIKQTHKSFLEAGAEIIITASYQASKAGFCDHLQIKEDKARKLMKLSASLAQEAVQEYYAKLSDKSQKPLVAGSIGPYGACLANFSEYTGAYISEVTSEELKEWHRPRMAALADSEVDLLAIETIPAQAEALSILDLLREFPNTKAWLSFSCKDGQYTNYGDSFGEAAKKCYEKAGDQLLAIGINCTPPQYITSLLDKANLNLPPPTVLPRVVYPDSGEHFTANKGWEGRSSKWSFLNEVKKWQAHGSSLIGGCCRLGPNDIKAIASVIASSSE